MGDLFALANAIAAIMGGAVTIEDPRARIDKCREGVQIGQLGAGLREHREVVQVGLRCPVELALVARLRDLALEQVAVMLQALAAVLLAEVGLQLGLLTLWVELQGGLLGHVRELIQRAGSLARCRPLTVIRCDCS